MWKNTICVYCHLHAQAADLAMPLWSVSCVHYYFWLEQVIDIMMKILDCSIENRDAKEGWLNIFSGIFEIFRSYLMGNSRKNKQYFMKYVEFCQTKFIAQVIDSHIYLQIILPS